MLLIITQRYIVYIYIYYNDITNWLLVIGFTRKTQSYSGICIRYVFHKKQIFLYFLSMPRRIFLLKHKRKSKKIVIFRVMVYIN